MGRTLKLNGVAVATPKVDGLKESLQPIWSSATGRTTSGLMQGNRVAYKVTLSITWPRLDEAEVLKIWNAITAAKDFFEVTYYSLRGSEKTLTMYAGPLDGTWHQWASGHGAIDGLTLELVER